MHPERKRPSNTKEEDGELRKRSWNLEHRYHYSDSWALVLRAKVQQGICPVITVNILILQVSRDYITNRTAFLPGDV